MTSDESDTNETNSGNKENIDTNKAAVVIQSRKYPLQNCGEGEEKLSQRVENID